MGRSFFRFSRHFVETWEFRWNAHRNAHSLSGMQFPADAW